MTDKRGTPGGLNKQKLGAHQGRLNITHVKRDTMDHHQSEKKGGHQGDSTENMFPFRNEIFVVFDTFKI